LYDVVRMMGESGLKNALVAVAERLRSELQLPALAVEFSLPNGELVRQGVGDATALRQLHIGSTAPSRVLQAGRAGSSSQHAKPGRWVRIVPTARPNVETLTTPVGKVDIVPIKVDERRVG